MTFIVELHHLYVIFSYSYYLHFILILKKSNLLVTYGLTVSAFRCGKSTIIQLLLRYYNPDSGSVNPFSIDK